MLLGQIRHNKLDKCIANFDMFAFRNIILRTITRKLSSSSRKDLYEILGIKPTASQDEIKSAYYIMTKRYHPDRSKGLPDAGRRFVQIVQAYEILSNENMRKKYDSGNLDVSSVPIPRDAANVIVERRFRDQSASKQYTEPGTNDFQRWTKMQHDENRAKKFKTGQNLAAKKQMHEELRFGTGVEVFIVAAVVVAFAVAVFHPFRDSQNKRKSRNRPD